MHNSIQNDPDKDVPKILFVDQRRYEVCSQGQVEKGPLGSIIMNKKKIN